MFSRRLRFVGIEAGRPAAYASPAARRRLRQIGSNLSVFLDPVKSFPDDHARQAKIRGPSAGRAGHERAFLQLVAGRTDPGSGAGRAELNAPDDCDLTKTGS
jgi:hypothetical protein